MYSSPSTSVKCPGRLGRTGERSRPAGHPRHRHAAQQVGLGLFREHRRRGWVATKRCSSSARSLRQPVAVDRVGAHPPIMSAGTLPGDALPDRRPPRSTAGACGRGSTRSPRSARSTAAAAPGSRSPTTTGAGRDLVVTWMRRPRPATSTIDEIGNVVGTLAGRRRPRPGA